MEQGWIYILVNSSIPGLAKVGRTTRIPAERAAELSAFTGVATPFLVAFEQAFADCVAAEQMVHQELDRRGLRAAPNREFFRGAISDLVHVVLETAADAPVAIPRRSQAASAAAQLARGDAHLHGLGETLEDLPEAVRLYRLAASRGSVVAFERLGGVFASLRTPSSRADRRRAMGFLKEGARRGNYYCYCEMALLFGQEGHVRNFAKAWDLFFARRADACHPDAEQGEDRYPMALRSYIAGCLDLRLAPAHMQQLRDSAEPLVESLGRALQRAGDIPGVHHHLALLLRWSYENLFPASVPTPPRRRAKWLPDWIAPARWGEHGSRPAPLPLGPAGA